MSTVVQKPLEAIDHATLKAESAAVSDKKL